MEDLEIIIPVKNENKNITRVLDSFFYEVKTRFTVTICFDDYKDTTIPAIKKYDRRQQFKIKLLKNKYYGINYDNVFLEQAKKNIKEKEINQLQKVNLV